MNFKKITSLVLGSVAALTLAACAAPTQSNTTQNEKADRSQKLIIYSNSVSNGRGEWLTNKAKEAGFNIEMVEIGGAELADRVIAEKNNGIADMVYGINAVDSNKLRDEKLLTQFTPEWIDKVDKTLGDKDGYYNPIFVQPLVFIGNSNVSEMPEDMTELATKFSGKYAIYGLTGGTGRMLLSSLLVRYLDDNGELGVSKEGWEKAKEYIQNAYILKRGEQTVIKTIDENDPINYGMIWGSGALQGQLEHKVKFKYMSPKIGVPFVTEQTMILASSKKQALAKEFINWFGQADIVKEYNQKFGSIPANQDAVKDISEDAKTLLATVKPQEIDWSVVGKHLDEWVEKVELEFVK